MERADGVLYAVYRGDELIVLGTLRECAERLGVSEKTVRWLSYPAAHRRAERKPGTMVAEKVEAEELDA